MAAKVRVKEESLRDFLWSLIDFNTLELLNWLVRKLLIGGHFSGCFRLFAPKCLEVVGTYE